MTPAGDSCIKRQPVVHSGPPPRGWKGSVRELVARRPGITIPEIAAEVRVSYAHLYRWMPNSELVKIGRGWHPKGKGRRAGARL